MNHVPIYALDFDGVICDSLIETALTGWKAASKIWPGMPEVVPGQAIEQFRLLRPILETGYEAILCMRLLSLGESAPGIMAGYHDKVEALLGDAQVSVDELKTLFGETRDSWIAADLDDWISKNPLFSGVAGRLRALSEKQTWYVVTTKHERFVKQILKANSIDLPAERIFGLDRKMSKAEVLTGLLKNHPAATFHFVEDRLPALISVEKNPALAPVRLFLALWGYNTAEDKADAAKHKITLLKREDFLVFDAG